MKAILVLLVGSGVAWPQIRMVERPSRAPLVDFRIVFMTGSAYDPSEKPGLAALTAALIAGGGTRELSYKQLLDAMFPMSGSVSSQVDKEMITFRGSTDIHNLEKYYALFRAILLSPGWREDDLRRIKDRSINNLRVGLRDSNEEELAKEVLYQTIYDGRPYGHHNSGTVSALQSMTIGDLRLLRIGIHPDQHGDWNRRRLPGGVSAAREAGFRSVGERRALASPGASAKVRRKPARGLDRETDSLGGDFSRHDSRRHTGRPRLSSLAGRSILPRATPGQRWAALRSHARTARAQLW